jgi:hypothetical protein
MKLVFKGWLIKGQKLNNSKDHVIYIKNTFLIILELLFRPVTYSTTMKKDEAEDGHEKNSHKYKLTQEW